MNRHPLLNIEPLEAGALQQIVRGIDPSLLRGVGKLRRLNGSWKREIHALFGSGIRFLKAVIEVDSLLIVVKTNLQIDRWRVYVRRMQLDRVAPGGLLCAEILAVDRRMNY